MDDSTHREALADALGAVTRQEDLDAILERIAGLAVGALGYESVAIYLADDLARYLGRAAAAGAGPEPPASVGIDDEGALARAAREKRDVVEDAHRALPLLLAGEGGALGGVLEARGGAVSAKAADTLAALAGIAALAVDRHRLRHALDERSEWFERLSEIDPLTGLANKRTLVRAIELELARAARQATTFQVVAFDIEGFEDLTARLGQGAGDVALRRIASLLTGKVRLIDTVGRSGASEFVVLAPGASGPALEERIVAAAATGSAEDGTPLGLRAGRAVYPDDGATAEELLQAAEHRLGVRA